MSCLNDYLQIEREKIDIFKSLNEFMLDNNMINTLKNIRNFPKEVVKKVMPKVMPKVIYREKSEKDKSDKSVKLMEVKEVKKSEIFFPKEKESLFWCFYIMKYGEMEYEMLEHKNIIIEKKIKIEYVEKMRKEKQLIKTYKLCSLTNMENNLVNEQVINLTSFLSLCVLENMNVLFIKNNTFYELLMNDTGTVNIIYKKNKQYGLTITTDLKKVHEIKNNLFKIDNVDKPIKSFSAYKLQDLLTICGKMSIETINIETNKTKNKTDLYESVIKHLHF